MTFSNQIANGRKVEKGKRKERGRVKRQVEKGR
jgi:hypothetical protein